MIIDHLFNSVLTENAEELNIGDPVIITGKGIEFEGKTGDIADFGRDKRFVIVNLYNHGKHSFHSSDVSYNDYADSDDEQEYQQGVAEGSVQDKLHKRHQELRKKSGLPDPDYYKELKATYDLPDQERYAKAAELKKKYNVKESQRTQCPECGGAAYEDRVLAEKQDACYHKVRSRYKVWPSAYASGALVQCRKKGAANWGNKSKK